MFSALLYLSPVGLVVQMRLRPQAQQRALTGSILGVLFVSSHTEGWFVNERPRNERQMKKPSQG